jgi:hypothetical protein
MLGRTLSNAGHVNRHTVTAASKDNTVMMSIRFI